MLNAQNYGITLARAAALFGTQAEAVIQLKGALRALVALSGLGEARVVVVDGELEVNDVPIAATLPFVGNLVKRLAEHDVRELRIARGASAADLLRLLRILGGQDEGTLGSSFESIGVTGIKIGAESVGGGRRPVSVTMAFDRDAVLAAAAEPGEPESVDEDEADRGDVSASDLCDSVESSLEEGDDSAALAGLSKLVSMVGEGPDEAAARLDEILQRETLTRVARFVTESSRLREAIAVLHRSGPRGADALIDQLMKAPSPEERATFAEAIFAIPSGLERMRELMQDDDEAMASLMIELCIELGIQGIESTLGAVATNNVNPAVRAAAYEALVKLGTPDSIAPLRSRLAGEEYPTLLRLIEKKPTEALIQLLVETAQVTPDAKARDEMHVTLGVVGGQAALEYLIKAALPGGRFFGRKPSAIRISAVRGLAQTDQPAAIGTLEELARDRNNVVAEAAREALREGSVGIKPA